MAGLGGRSEREHDPAVGKYSQSAPIGLAGGVSRYGYVAGDPLNWSEQHESG